MSPIRIPWWIWLAAACFITCFVVGFLYLPLQLPEAAGINPSFPSNQVSSVTPGSPGDVAGFKKGDRIVDINGRIVRNVLQFGSALSNTTFDHPVPIVVLRGGQEVHLQLSLKRTLMEAWTPKEQVGWWVEVAVSLIQLLSVAS